MKRSEAIVKGRTSETDTRTHTERSAHIRLGSLLHATRIEGQRLLAIFNQHPNFYDYGQYAKISIRGRAPRILYPGRPANSKNGWHAASPSHPRSGTREVFKTDSYGYSGHPSNPTPFASQPAYKPRPCPGLD